MDDFGMNPQAILQHVLDTARAYGASAADALLVAGSSTEVRVRLGEVEQVKQSLDRGVGVRVFVGDRSATTSSSDLDEASLRALVARTCEAARLTAADGFAGLPDSESLADEPLAGLDLDDPSLEALSVERALDLAREAEAAALAADARIANSEGAEMAWGRSETHLASTAGIYRTQRSGSVALWATPVAQAGGAMERDTWASNARHLADLAAPEEIGREAARRALRRLGARKPETCQVPVVFEWPVASRLLASLAGALLGGAIYRRSSYLCDELGHTIAAPSIQIVDDPHVRRGPGSRGFDGEGLATRPTRVVRDGVLASYLLDTYSAAKLGLASTRSASRGLAGTPTAAASNFWMEAGDASLDELVAGTRRGVLVTELFGFGANAVTGDFSQGAVGLWIEGGRLTHPVSEMTIASTLQQMWRDIDGIADDRDPSRRVSAPSLRIGRMTVAGS